MADLKEGHEAYKYMGGYLQDLNTLETRYPEFTTGELAVSRAALEERQRKVQQQAETLGISIEAPASEFGELEASSLPESTLKIASTNPNRLVLGDAASIADGGWLTVHSYESPVSAPSSKKHSEPGHEFSAIEVEGYAGENIEDYLDGLGESDFKLQMPDNTRLQWAFAVYLKQPALHYTRLTPGDCVRGWITFQTPQVDKPKFVVYSRKRTVLKWSIPED